MTLTTKRDSIRNRKSEQAYRSKEIELVIKKQNKNKNYSQKKAHAQMASLVSSTKHLRKD